jgi:hypothetical protein
MARRSYTLQETARGVPGVLPLLFELRRTLRGCRTVLDLGCGPASPLRALRVETLVGLEGFEPSLRQAQAAQTHDEWVFGDVRDLGRLLAGRRFDGVVALDLIEHLPKDDGWRLLEAMETLAARKAVVFTPNGFLPQQGHGDLQEHLSGWSPTDLRSRGYEVIGFYGHKALRGGHHRLKHRPKVFWALVSQLSQSFYARQHPEQAAAIYAVKSPSS